MPCANAYKLTSQEEAIDSIWVLTSTGMIFFMQAGFALVECGSIRKKNSHNILIKNVFDACIGAIAFWIIGYGLAFGDVRKFVGTDGGYFAAKEFDCFEDDHY